MKEEGRGRRRIWAAAAAAGILALIAAAAAFFLGGLALTTDTVNGWHGLCLGAELTLTGRPFVRMSDDPLRYFTRHGDVGALAEIEGAALDREQPAKSGHLLIDGTAYSYGGGAFASRFWIWTLEPTGKEPAELVRTYVREFIAGRGEEWELPEPAAPLDELGPAGDAAALAAAVQGHFGVELPAAEIAGWKTVEDVVSSTAKRL